MIVFLPNCFQRKILVCGAALCVFVRLQAQDELVYIKIDPTTTLGRISEDFIGFGYETSAVAQANFFNPNNSTMVQLYRNLSPHGLIRIGGNVSDHTKYVPEGVPRARTEKEVTIINRVNLADLGGFARATGWRVMWGLNLGSGSKEEAVQEAVAVNVALSNSLQSFEIGNEVEALRRFSGNYEAYHTAYLDYKAAIRAALPHAPFSGPDSIGHWDWVTNFAATEAKDIRLLTEHYYRGGAKDPSTTIEKLLQPDHGWEKRLKKLQQLSTDTGIAFRINEVNSFSGGGKEGVSDTFAEALWCLDYMFRLASYGCDGVNMETDLNQLGWISHYSPIVHDATGYCGARAEYYGMLAFAIAGKGELLQLTLNKTDVNLSAYATRDSEGSIWITVVNKDSARDAMVQSVIPDGYFRAAVFRLSALSLESKNHVTLAGTEVSPNGRYTAGSPEQVNVKEHSVRLLVPHASAALLHLRRN
jgi:hypothetical protein